jgi:polyhydroxyalkanoate synthesis repressor PhaR
MMVTIKRYPNRKLYDTEARQYITLDGIAMLIRAGNEVQVIDHSTGEDLTAITLTQIILEQEKKEAGFLSDSFLVGLIRASGERLAALQHSFRWPQNFWRQIDEEIKLRVQALVHAGELTEKESRRVLDKLLSQTARVNESQRLDEQIEAFLEKHQIPTQNDIQNLQLQLEEIIGKLNEITSPSQNS